LCDGQSGRARLRLAGGRAGGGLFPNGADSHWVHHDPSLRGWFFHWYFANANHIAQLQQDDPGEALQLFWHAMRGSLCGVALFLFALVWAGINQPSNRASPPAQGIVNTGF